MSMIKKFLTTSFVVSLFLLNFETPLLAQRTISVDEAIKIALEQNNRIRRGQSNIAFQEIGVTRAKANYFIPDLNLSGGPGVNWGLGFDQTIGALVTERSERVSANLSSSVNLFNGFTDKANYDAAKIGLEASESQFERTRQDVLFDVVQRYLNVIVNREQIAIQEQDLESQNQLLARVEQFVEVGSRPESDLFQQQATTAQSESNLLNAQRLYNIAEATLIQALELDPLQEYEFVAPSPDDLVVVPGDFELESLLREAAERRYDLKAAKLNIDAADLDIKAAKGGRLPRVDLSGSYGSSYSSFQIDPTTGETKGLGSQFNDNRSWGVNLGIGVPIFNRFLTKANIRQAEVVRNNTELDYQILEQSVALEIKQAYQDYLFDAKQIEVTEKQLVAAEKAFEAEQERYNVGASTLVELSQARTNFVRASSSRINALYTYITRSKLIDYYVGVIDPSESIFR